MATLATSIGKNCPKYRCETCDYATSKLTDYNKHLLTRKHQEVLALIGKNCPKYRCEKCDYNANKKSHFDSHLKTTRHLEVLASIGNICRDYRCELCDYTANKKSHYDIHLTTMRHIKNASTDDSEASYYCKDCDYKTFIKSNYNKHLLSQKHLAKSCTNENTDDDDYNEEYDDISCVEQQEYDEQETIDNNMLLKLILENQNIQKQLIEHIGTMERTIGEMSSTNSDTIKQLSDTLTTVTTTIQKLSTSNTTTNNNTTNNNTINNNNTANINIFLNERCKDAMNMTDFLNTIKYTAETLKYMERNGFANTMTKLFTDKLHEMSIYQRPIHCTDIKREVLYIKDNDEWQKNTNEKNMRDEMVNKYIPKMERDNRIAFSQYNREHPEYHEMGHPEYESFFKMAREVNNGRDKESNDMKIIKNLCKETHLTRDAIKDK